MPKLSSTHTNTEAENEPTLGELIKNYRMEKGLSQLELEVGIGAAFGSLTKIENNKINPSKQSLHKIIEFLELPPMAAARLFNIDIGIISNVITQLNKLQNVTELNQLLDIALHDIRLHLGLAGGAFYLVQDNKLCIKALSSTNFIASVRRILKEPLSLLKFDLEKDTDNLLVKAVLENQIVITSNLYEMMRPKVTQWLAEKAQKLTLTKQIMALPVLKRGEVSGLIVYGSLTGGDFRHEIEPLKSFALGIGETLDRIL